MKDKQPKRSIFPISYLEIQFFNPIILLLDLELFKVQVGLRDIMDIFPQPSAL